MKTKEVTKTKVSDNGLLEQPSLQKELDSIVSQYNEAVQKKSQYDNLATRCLGAIEILEKLMKGQDAEIREDK